MSGIDGLRVGFVGAGWSDRVQIPVFRLAGLQPQAVAAAHVENARAVAQRHNIPDVHPTWQELIASERVDIVSIVTPPPLHREIAVAALQAGKHVICEKPTALNVAEAEAMLAAAQAAPSRLAIIDHELRFHPQRRQLRQLIREGYVGALLHIHLDRLGDERLDGSVPWTWLHDADQGGGVLCALGSHLIDLARWLVGRIETLTAQLQIGHLHRLDSGAGFERPVTADDHAHLLLRFANGAHGTITASGLTPGASGMSVTAVGTHGALRLDYEDRLWAMRGERYPHGAWEPVPPADRSALLSQLPNQRSFTVGTLHLAEALARSLPVGEVQLDDTASFYDGLVVQRAIDAARRSHANQTWEKI